MEKVVSVGGVCSVAFTPWSNKITVVRGILILSLLLACTGCDQMMHDAVREEGPAGCGNTYRPDENRVSSGLDGKQLFQMHCATCHNPIKDATGPALQGSLNRWKNDTIRLYAFIRNANKMIKKRDPYAMQLYKQWNKTEMTAFPHLTNEEITAILSYTNYVP